MITDNNSEHEKPEEFSDEETLKEKYAELYNKVKDIDSEDAEIEGEFVVPSAEEKAKSMKLAFDCAEIGDSMRAQDIKVIDVTGRTSLADFIVFMSGYNKRQIQGIANDFVKAMKRRMVKISWVEGFDISWWILVDLNTVIVHIFYEDARKYYELDTLWQDAPIIFSEDKNSSDVNEGLSDVDDEKTAENEENENLEDE